ncbi:MAG: hypothetical protein ABIL45_02050 [candidate division WOR-3 bacterium]
MKNFLILLSISLTLYLSSALFKLYYESKVYNKTFIADISSKEKLLSKDYVGAMFDSYLYIKNAYEIYKSSKPENCFRPQVAYFFAIFMFIFNKYFPLAIILLNSLLFAILLAILLNLLNPNKLITNIIILLLIFPFTFYYIPRILLEPFITNFTLTSLIFLALRRKNFALFFIFLASILRPEFILLVILYGIFLKSYLLSIALTTINLIPNLILSKCRDQTNFLNWSIVGYYEKVKNKSWEEAKKELLSKCKNLNNDCYLSFFIEEFKQNPNQIISLIAKNTILNPIKFLFFPINYKEGKRKVLNGFYFVISIIYSIILIISIIKQKNEKLVIYSLLTIVLFYSLFFSINPEGFTSRFKILLIPFETYLIAKTFSNYLLIQAFIKTL